MDWNEPIMGSSSMMAPLALQAASCLSVSPLTARKSVSFTPGHPLGQISRKSGARAKTTTQVNAR